MDQPAGVVMQPSAPKGIESGPAPMGASEWLHRANWIPGDVQERLYLRDPGNWAFVQGTSRRFSMNRGGLLPTFLEGGFLLAWACFIALPWVKYLASRDCPSLLSSACYTGTDGNLFAAQLIALLLLIIAAFKLRKAPGLWLRERQLRERGRLVFGEVIDWDDRTRRGAEGDEYTDLRIRFSFTADLRKREAEETVTCRGSWPRLPAIGRPVAVLYADEALFELL